MMKFLKYSFLCAVMILFSGQIKAQQEPLFTNYMFNMMSVNAAYTGTRNALNVFALSRLQWVGMDGAPTTHTLSLHTPINSKKIGIGFSIIDDEIGPLRNTYLNLNYAYRLKLNEFWTLSMGIKGGINSFYLGLSSLELNQINDPSFTMSTEKRLVPNVGLGAYLYNDRFYAGVSAPKLIQSKLNQEDPDINDNELKRHYFFISGYILPINHMWVFKPSILTRVVVGAPVSLDLTAQFLYQDKIWLGTTYRIGDALAFLLNLKINRQLTLGYSYDISINKLGAYNRGTHEIMITYDFDGFINNKLKSPRYF